ncbi:hypothetical protein XA68_11357 [Ophiocordyceps unilateralis]|uniref:C3H1-type domain-containing protein n=1 Tax=Ophiocordyceps unilateralis TaxID=268505 RepID=A0A2A9PFK5_OPHUN|nr:hypothetical protein XA68_11357 [Ophiocordyceps unilateralis]
MPASAAASRVPPPLPRPPASPPLSCASSSPLPHHSAHRQPSLLLRSPPSLSSSPLGLERRPLLRHSILAAAAATMPEYRHVRSGSLNIANGPGHGGQMMPRSPPNTSHVPCKFFRQGTCQAGNACPFSHDIGTSAETVCKYFAKGNCKFGPKCANVHVLPDGRRINYGKNGVTIGAAPINLAARAPPTSASPSPSAAGAYPHGSSSALTSSLYRADYPSYPNAYPTDDGSPNQHHRLGRQPSLDNGIPAIDMPYNAHPGYDSPRGDDDASSVTAAGRFDYGLSPVNGKGLSVLDAPLPSSFDSNGISNAARFPSAPWPSSVPSKFGLDSPTPSLSNAREGHASETLKLLHSSAFGPSEHLAAPAANSPPSSQPINGDEYFGRRAMHSSRYAKPRMLSSSVPKAMSVDRDWEEGFAFGDDGENVPENYLPENLQDLLTPAEKARRGSMRVDGDAAVEAMSKYGSPVGSSPSRWGPLFQRQKEDEDATRAARAAGSVFGHVGSPLRKSTLAQEMGGDSRASPLGGAVRPLSSSRTGSEPMSVLSQQLQRSRLDDGSSPLLHPMAARISSAGVGAIGKDRAIERHVSSGSIGSSVTGRFTTPIDEEDPAFVFSMEEEDDSGSSRARKRVSAGLAMSGLATYAGAAGTGKGATGGPKDAVSVNGR